MRGLAINSILKRAGAVPPLQRRPRTRLGNKGRAVMTVPELDAAPCLSGGLNGRAHTRQVPLPAPSGPVFGNQKPISVRAEACPADVVQTHAPIPTAVLLNTGGTQALEAVAVHLHLPVQELLRGQTIADTCVAHRK